MEDNFIIKGDICYSKNKDELISGKDKYLVCDGGLSMGVFDEIPEVYKDFKLYDYSDKLILPGLIDLHVHAPQYTFRGLGMDLELLDWLNRYTFPEEAKYGDIAYARKAYESFVRELKFSSTTRACVFASLHVDSTILLMNLLEKSGLISYVGKVNMDRNAIEDLEEVSAKESLSTTKAWLDLVGKKYARTFPIISPRFTPSCSDELMEGLGYIVEEYSLPVQSHLSENPGEIEWVKELCPWAKCYGDTYDRYKLFGSISKTIMAHCVWSDEREQRLIKERGVFIAHCPNSNLNLASGIAPIRKYLDQGQNIGLGSDVAAGSHLSIFRQVSDAIQVSKMYWRYIDQRCKPLSIEEGFYLATLGGGKFFGKVGSFDKGYEFDALVIDDADYKDKGLSIKERLERTIYISEPRHVRHKWTRGREVF